MTDMLSLFDEPVQSVAVPVTPVARPAARRPCLCCGLVFETFPAFLGHLSAAQPVVVGQA
jgi:hypothetical protein